MITEKSQRLIYFVMPYFLTIGPYALLDDKSPEEVIFPNGPAVVFATFFLT